MQVHASAVAVGGAAVLLRGPPGAGKSDLALRLIDGGAALVADDRCDLRVEGGRLWVSAPASIAGLIEVRGLGILRLAALPGVPVALVADLVPAADVPRLPEPVTVTLLGIEVPLVVLAPFEASTPAKLRLALGRPHSDTGKPP